MLVDPHREQINELASKVLNEVSKNIPGIDNSYLEDTYTSVSLLNNKHVDVKYPSKIQFPTEIDIVFYDDTLNKSYVIYITEVNEDNLESLLQEICSLITGFLMGDYRVVEKKGFLFRRSYLEFDNPHLTYTIANPTRRR